MTAAAALAVLPPLVHTPWCRNHDGDRPGDGACYSRPIHLTCISSPHGDRIKVDAIQCHKGTADAPTLGDANVGLCFDDGAVVDLTGDQAVALALAILASARLLGTDVRVDPIGQRRPGRWFRR